MSGQNTSTAVMQRRKAGTARALDDFPTPPWAVRGFVHHVLARRDQIGGATCWEPCCNRGFMARPLAEAFGTVWCSDVHDYGWQGQQAVHDFLLPHVPQDFPPRVDWVITNPPFRLAEQVIRRGLDVARVGVAVLVRSAFLESRGRYEALFRDTPPTLVAQYVERVPMVEGRFDPAASTATAYCWLVWQRPYNSSRDFARMDWIPPCRATFERAGDAVPDTVTTAAASPLFDGLGDA